jgi:hypothetical protein
LRAFFAKQSPCHSADKAIMSMIASSHPSTAPRTDAAPLTPCPRSGGAPGRMLLAMTFDGQHIAFRQNGHILNLAKSAEVDDETQN